VLNKFVNKSAHVLSGVFCAIALPYRPLLGFVALFLFLIYEFLQYFYKVDWPISEVREFSVGFFAAGFLVLLSLLG